MYQTVIGEIRTDESGTTPPYVARHHERMRRQNRRDNMLRDKASRGR